MKEFFIGLLVLLAFSVLILIGFLLSPILVVLGFFLKFLFTVILFIAAIWILGKVTILGIERLQGKK